MSLRLGGVTAGGVIGDDGLLADVDDTLEGGLEVQTLRGELTGGTGTELHGLDVAGDIEVVLRVGTALGILDADGEDGKVVDLDILAFEHQLLDTGDHVGEQALDDALREWSVVTGHVGRESVDVNGFLNDGISVELTVIVGLLVVVRL